MIPSAHNTADQKVELNAPLETLKTSELELLLNITLRQLRQASNDTALLLLGRVWYRLEQERRRRASEVQELERMYFAK